MTPTILCPYCELSNTPASDDKIQKIKATILILQVRQAAGEHTLQNSCGVQPTVVMIEDLELELAYTQQLLDKISGGENPGPENKASIRPYRSLKR